VINASPEPADVLNLTENMGDFRVVDRRALVSVPTFEAKIAIAGKSHRRRVIRSDAIVAVIQETDQVAPGVDGWHTEGMGSGRGEVSLAVC